LDITKLFNPQESEDFSLLQSNEAKRLFFQYFFKRNFPAFVYLLGYRQVGEFHQKEVKTLSGMGKRRLWLWARGHFKTSLITEAHSVWLIVNNPNIRILIVSNTISIAKTMLKKIREIFTSNEDFRYFFREFCPKENKDGKVEWGTTENFTVINRTKVQKEPTMMCAGIGTNLTGLHFDKMKIDDLVTKDSVSNEEQIKASKEYYSSLRQLFDIPTEPDEDISGTTYHFNDLYQDLLKNPDFEKSIIPAKINDKIVFHERFTEEGLESILNDPSVGPWQYHAQYMLNPVNPQDAKFKSEWVEYYDTLPEGLVEYICVDPASTRKKKSDFTVIERWGIDHEGYHYLLEGVRDKFTVFQRIDKLFEVVKRAKNLKRVKYEVLGGRHGDLENIRKRQREEQNSFLIEETKSTNASKEDRIEQRLVGPYHAGMIRFPRKLSYKSLYDGKTYDFVQDLITELLQFPHTVHDDCLDCQSQMFEERLAFGDKPKVIKDFKWHAPTPEKQRDKFLKKQKPVIKIKNIAVGV